MRVTIQSALLGVPVLICVTASQFSAAQLASHEAAGASEVLTTEEIVSRLVRRNLERSRALAAYRGTRTYRLDYHGFPGARAAEMVVDVSYTASGAEQATKEFQVRSESGSKLLIERVFKRMLQSEKEAV